MERSIAFYADILGLELLRSGERLAFFRSGKDHVVLALADVPPSAAEVRNVHHAFIVESRDFDESLVFLRSNGVDVVFEEERSGDSVFSGRSAYFRDPDGNVLEIIDLSAMAFRPRPKAAAHV